MLLLLGGILILPKLNKMRKVLLFLLVGKPKSGLGRITV